MGQIKFDIGASSDEASKMEGAGGARYDGPMPPKDTYRVIIKRLAMKTNKNKDPMINGVAEINEPEGSNKAKFNGYGIWFNQNVTKQGAGYVNQFLDAISGGDEAIRKGFWTKGVSVEDQQNLKNAITKIAGKLRVNSDGMPAKLSAKNGEDQNGNPRLEVGAWLLPVNQDESDDDGDDEDDEDIDVEDASDEDDSDDSDDEEDSDEEDADEEDEDSEDEDSEDEDEADEEDGEDDDGERLRELEALSRPDLVKVAKSLSIKTGKSKTNEDYIKEILEAEEESDEAPF